MRMQRIAVRRLRLPTGPGPRHESGSVLVEFAIVLVLLLALTLGVVDGARLIWDYSVLSNAVTEGVRCASVRGSGSKTTSTCAYNPDATACGATDFTCVVQNMAVGLNPAPSVTVTCTDASGNTVTCPAKQGGVVRIQAQYTFTPITPLYPFGTITLSNSSEMMIAR